MNDEYPALKSPIASVAAVFPTLNPAQIEHLAAQGRLRQMQPGEVLVEAGEKNAPLFVVKTGQVEVVQPSSLPKNQWFCSCQGSSPGKSASCPGSPYWYGCARRKRAK